MFKAIELTAQSFNQEVLESSNPVLVDFYATWCGPCQMMAPVLDELSGVMTGKVKIAKINIDVNNDLASKYEVASIPNMKLFKNGKVVDEFIGVQPMDVIQKQLEKHL